MAIKNVIKILLQVPAWLVLVGAFFTSVYAWLNKIQNIGIWTPLILLIVIVLYIIGRLIPEDVEE